MKKSSSIGALLVGAALSFGSTQACSSANQPQTAETTAIPSHNPNTPNENDGGAEIIDAQTEFHDVVVDTMNDAQQEDAGKILDAGMKADASNSMDAGQEMDAQQDSPDAQPNCDLISDAYLSPNPMNPNAQNTTINFTTTKLSDITIIITQNGATIKSLGGKKGVTQDYFTYDGTNAFGDIVALGDYQVKIIAQEKDGTCVSSKILDLQAQDQAEYLCQKDAFCMNELKGNTTLKLPLNSTDNICDSYMLINNAASTLEMKNLEATINGRSPIEDPDQNDAQDLLNGKTSVNYSNFQFKELFTNTTLLGPTELSLILNDNSSDNSQLLTLAGNSSVKPKISMSPTEALTTAITFTVSNNPAIVGDHISCKPQAFELTDLQGDSYLDHVKFTPKLYPKFTSNSGLSSIALPATVTNN